MRFDLPDDATVTLTVRELRELVARGAGGEAPEFVSTVQAARILGKYAKWWERAARDSKIDGAFQPAEGEPWVLPLASCRAYLTRLQRTFDRSKAWKRGPQKRSAA